jgi:hypothetical protein
MRVYISSKKWLYRKWFFIILSFLLFIGANITFWQYFTGVHHNYTGGHSAKEDFWGGVFWLAMSIIIYYNAIKPSILIVEDDKIVLQGIFKKIIYRVSDFKEFKEVPTAFGRNKFYILFRDGKSFWIECKANVSFYYRHSHSNEVMLEGLNTHLNYAIGAARNNH